MARGKDKKAQHERRLDHAEAMSYADQARPSEMMDRELMASMGRSIYMVHDPEMVTWSLSPKKRQKNPYYSMYPATSLLNRTSNITEQEARILTLEYEGLELFNKICSNEEEYNTEGWRSSWSLRIHQRLAVRDSVKGWKGKIMVEQLKRVVTELREVKKKGILPF